MKNLSQMIQPKEISEVADNSHQLLLAIKNALDNGADKLHVDELVELALDKSEDALIRLKLLANQELLNDSKAA